MDGRDDPNSRQFQLNRSVLTLSLLDLMNNLPMDYNDMGLDSTLEESLNDEKKVKRPLNKEYKKNLTKYTIQKEDIDKVQCAICQDKFKEGDEVIRLECNSHFFHQGNDEDECCGIYPWFEENNTCPICRMEFPYEEEVEVTTDNEEGSERYTRMVELVQSILRGESETESISDINETNMDDILRTVNRIVGVQPLRVTMTGTMEDITNIIEERQFEEAIQRSIDEQ
tara:strand:- start:1817 stop:2497 length:681 start_codon:yes stop_codon:yes gene_type:complete